MRCPELTMRRGGSKREDGRAQSDARPMAQTTVDSPIDAGWIHGSTAAIDLLAERRPGVSSVGGGTGYA
jgi:hypothetical protein